MGLCLAVIALVCAVFIHNLPCAFVMCMRVCVRVRPECVSFAACSASLGPLMFHGSRRELLATIVIFCWLVFVCGAAYVILLDAFIHFVGQFWFCIRYIVEGFSQWRVVVGYALQVFPVVTRLTVCRWLQGSRRAAAV